MRSALEARLASRGATLADSRISLRIRHGVRFVFREGLLSVFTLPIAVLGRATHWIPIHAARTLALHSAARDPSRDQPAMRTIVFGAAAVLLWYGLQAVLITHWLSGVIAALWLAMIFVAAQVDVLLEDRLLHAWRRARTYLTLRRDARLRTAMRGEIDNLLEEAVRLEQALTPGEQRAARP
jgi:hypothetical protein